MMDIFAETDSDGKVWYTYSIYSDVNVDELDATMKLRGNWKKVFDSDATFIYTYVKKDMRPKKESWKHQAFIKNSILPADNFINNKSALYNSLTAFDPKIANKYMVEQFDVDLENYYRIDRNLFLDKKWILKPVYSWGGIGIKIFENYDSFIKFMEEDKKLSETLNSKKKEKKKWVLAKYIDNPLLYLDRKFHFRVPYLYYNRQGFIGKKFSIITAGTKYVSGDYQNKEIHDTHVEKSIHGLLFPRDFDQKFVKHIELSVRSLFGTITSMINANDQTKCYPDSNKCYVVYGADIMVTDDLKIKLLEINIDAGFSGFIGEVFAGEMSVIIDPIFKPENQIENNNFFIKLNPNENMQRLYRKYKSKYRTIKLEGGIHSESESESESESKSESESESKSDQSYPLYKESYTLTRDRFDKLVDSFRPKIIHEVPAKMNANNMIVHKYNGEYWLIEENWKANEELNNVTDYFTEECRIKCRFGKHDAPIEFWSKNQRKIPKHNVREYLYRHTKLCNNFRISVALTILQIFRPTKWLDISAGWGDRLIAAIGYGVDLYCGIDPNECLHPKYTEIIKMLVEPDKQSNFILIKDGFETAKLPNVKFDLVFSSPPFFDLEVYSTVAEDSLMMYDTVNSWYNNFLLVSIRKAYKYLENGGHLVLYMGEGTQTKYIGQMIKDVKQFMKYRGVIYYFYPNKNIPRPMFVWRKN